MFKNKNNTKFICNKNYVCYFRRIYEERKKEREKERQSEGKTQIKEKKSVNGGDWGSILHF